ncbi:MAG: Fic family protein [Anaerobutyricum sp.]
MIEALLAEYTGKKKVELRDIAKFHAVFENIHPLQDGNKLLRVGRMILLKQCL